MVNGPWGGYSNGRIPTTALTRVQYPGVDYWVWSSNPADGALDGVYLEPGCAVALLAMLKRYHDDTGGFLPVNEGYRTYDGQVYWKNQDSRNATPGTSNHGWAKAVDMGDALTLDQYNWIHANGPTFGFTPLGGAFGQYDYIHYDYSGSYTPPEEDDMYDANAEARLNARLDGLSSKLDTVQGKVLEGVRREARGRLYFDSGATGTVTEANATRFIVAKLSDGFIYPLSPDPATRAGQVLSLRNTGYQLIDAAEVAVGLPTSQFNNLIEMANGHLRRVGAEVLRQQSGGATPPVTGTAPVGGASPTAVLS